MNVIAISRCVGFDLNTRYRASFHFKGFLRGQKVRMMSLVGGGECVVGEDYILQIKVDKLVDGILFGQILRKNILGEIIIG